KCFGNSICRLSLHLHRQLAQRNQCGLLRKGQVVLLEAWVQSWMDEFQHELSSELVREEDLPIINQNFLAATTFFSRIRSERLENLILRYPAEEGVNMEVANGVNAATKQFMIHQYPTSPVLPNL